MNFKGSLSDTSTNSLSVGTYRVLDDTVARNSEKAEEGTEPRSAMTGKEETTANKLSDKKRKALLRSMMEKIRNSTAALNFSFPESVFKWTIAPELPDEIPEDVESWLLMKFPVPEVIVSCENVGPADSENTDNSNEDVSQSVDAMDDDDDDADCAILCALQHRSESIYSNGESLCGSHLNPVSPNWDSISAVTVFEDDEN